MQRAFGPSPVLPVLVAILTAVASGAVAAARDAPYTPTCAYQERWLAGFRVRVHPELLARPEVAGRTVALLEEKLAEAARLLPEGPLGHLRDVTLWVEWENRTNGAAEYHPSREWLRRHGYNPEKAGGVEISNARNFLAWTRSDQPMMILHELAHAYQHRVLGPDYAPLHAAYRNAVESGRYDAVPYVRGGKRRAYALSNPQEYFAELSEAYFGRNDFYPFVREELRRHDPEGYRLMQRAWGDGEPAAATRPQRAPGSSGSGGCSCPP